MTTEDSNASKRSLAETIVLLFPHSIPLPCGSYSKALPWSKRGLPHPLRIADDWEERNIVLEDMKALLNLKRVSEGQAIL